LFFYIHFYKSVHRAPVSAAFAAFVSCWHIVFYFNSFALLYVFIWFDLIMMTKLKTLMQCQILINSCNIMTTTLKTTSDSQHLKVNNHGIYTNLYTISQVF